MIERRNHERKPINMEQAANANAWERWSKLENRWALVRDWPDQFQPKKKGKK